MSKETEIVPKSKEIVSFSDYDVRLSQLPTATLMKLRFEKFPAYNISPSADNLKSMKHPWKKLPLKISSGFCVTSIVSEER